MKAAVMRANNAPLELEEVQIDDPGPGEVLVKTKATGICHSDLTVLEGGLPLPPPCILGHEPAGIVAHSPPRPRLRISVSAKMFSTTGALTSCPSCWIWRHMFDSMAQFFIAL